MMGEQKEDMIQRMLSKKSWALVGATNKRDKVAYRILQKLLFHGYCVTCVNPQYKIIDKRPCYPRIDAIESMVEVINFVVPPAVSLKIVKDLSLHQVPYLWFQPGSFDASVSRLARDKGFCVIDDGSCVMVALRTHQHVPDFCANI